MRPQCSGIWKPLICSRAFLSGCVFGHPFMAQMEKNRPAMRETWVQSLGRDDPLEEGMATCSRMLAWRIPMDRERSLAGDGPWCHKESDMTKRLTHTLDMCVWTCFFVCVCVCAHLSSGTDCHVNSNPRRGSPLNPIPLSCSWETPGFSPPLLIWGISQVSPTLVPPAWHPSCQWLVGRNPAGRSSALPHLLS